MAKNRKAVDWNGTQYDLSELSVEELQELEEKGFAAIYDANKFIRKIEKQLKRLKKAAGYGTSSE